MKPILSPIILLLLAVLPFTGLAQEEAPLIHQGRRYIDCNISSLDKYSKCIERQQSRLLARLKRKEACLLRRLSGKDSLACAKLAQQPLSYDSIGKMLKPDSATLAGRGSRRSQPAIDSLKRIQGYLQLKAGALNTEASGLTSYDPKLADLQGKLNYQQYIQGLIDQRTTSLKNIGGPASGFKGIEKQVFYAKSKMKVYKQMADDPSIAEEKALEYLQGEKGFDQALSKPAAGSMQAASSVDDLEKMGFQTKRQLNTQLQKQFGDGLGAVQEKMGSHVSDWQNETQGMRGQVSDAANQVKTAKTDLQQAKQSIKQAKNIQKPSFKVNPMRGLPFRQRIEKQYGFQTSRATTDGRPAMLELSAMAGFKHTPSLSYGLGIATSFGLGQSWSNIRLSFEGIGLRSYATWKWQYGIGAYAGYERVYKLRTPSNSNELLNTEYSSHNTSGYNESVLIGLTKAYKVNPKWNGQIQLLYDIWWKEKGLRSPIVLRFATTKK